MPLSNPYGKVSAVKNKSSKADLIAAAGFSRYGALLSAGDAALPLSGVEALRASRCWCGVRIGLRPNLTPLAFASARPRAVRSRMRRRSSLAATPLLRVVELLLSPGRDDRFYTRRYHRPDVVLTRLCRNLTGVGSILPNVAIPAQLPAPADCKQLT
jgi:hypothetical protein